MRAAAVGPQRIKHFTRCLLAALAFSAVVVAPASAATSASGSIGIRLLEAPLTARDDPRAQIYIVDHLAPGTTIHRRIEISNTKSSAAHVAMYSSAATIARGSFLGAVGHTRNELSTWTSIGRRALNIPAGGLSEVDVTIAVPTDAAPGEQYAVVWAEERSEPKDPEGIVQVSRVGIRIYLSVGPGNPPATDFTIDSLTAKRLEDGSPVVLASVHNIGGRALDMNGTLQLLNGPSGLTAGPFPASLGTTLAIDETEYVMIPLDKELPAGPWNARIVLRSGLLERDARATITFPASGTAAPAVTTEPTPLWIYVAIAMLGFLLLLGLAIFLARRGYQRRREDSGLTVV